MISLNVGNDITSITVAANAADDLSSIFITGNQTTSDTINLAVGTNTIPIEVKAKDATT